MSGLDCCPRLHNCLLCVCLVCSLARCSPSLKVVVNALLMSIPAVADVMLILFIVFLIFAIVGVNYFKGCFYSCQGGNQKTNLVVN